MNRGSWSCRRASGAGSGRPATARRPRRQHRSKIGEDRLFRDRLVPVADEQDEQVEILRDQRHRAAAAQEQAPAGRQHEGFESITDGWGHGAMARIIAAGREEVSMRRMLLRGIVTAAALAAGPLATSAVLAGQTAAGARTPWGDPDLQGTWTNSTITPLERPAAFAGREFLTEEEARKLEAAAASRTISAPKRGGRLQRRLQPVLVGARRDRGDAPDVAVIDPPDGRIPALTPDGEKRAADVAAAMRGESSGPENRQPRRALHARAGAPKLPGGYNNNFQIVQTPGYVAIMQEMIPRGPHHPARRPQARTGGDALLAGRFARTLGRRHAGGRNDELPRAVTVQLVQLLPLCRGEPADRRTVPPRRREDDRPSVHRRGSDDLHAAVHVAVPMTKMDSQSSIRLPRGNYGMEGILRGARAQERVGGVTQDR